MWHILSTIIQLNISHKLVQVQFPSNYCSIFFFFKFKVGPPGEETDNNPEYCYTWVQLCFFCFFMELHKGGNGQSFIHDSQSVHVLVKPVVVVWAWWGTAVEQHASVFLPMPCIIYHPVVAHSQSQVISSPWATLLCQQNKWVCLSGTFIALISQTPRH